MVGDALEFGNSWKSSPSCPDAPAPRDPCTANPYRKSWAQKQCSLINSAPFEACRSQVGGGQWLWVRELGLRAGGWGGLLPSERKLNLAWAGPRWTDNLLPTDHRA